jgi:hypothetical protein
MIKGVMDRIKASPRQGEWSGRKEKGEKAQ